jgi:hypothetical protein
LGRNAAGQLIHLFESGWIPSNTGECIWQGENVTQDIAQRFPNSGDFTFGSDLNILNAPNSYVEHAFARNSANQLIHYWYLADVQGWGAENLTTKYPNCPECRIFGNLAVVNGGDNTTQHAFGTNANNELIQYWWDPWSSWHDENLTARANIGPAFKIVSDVVAINDPWVGNPNFATSQIGQNVFGRNANGELIHYYWYPQPSWRAENLTQTATSNVDIHFRDSLVAVNDGLYQYVFARNANNELIYYQGFPWPASSGVPYARAWAGRKCQPRARSQPVSDCR